MKYFTLPAQFDFSHYFVNIQPRTYIINYDPLAIIVNTVAIVCTNLVLTIYVYMIRWLSNISYDALAIYSINYNAMVSLYKYIVLTTTQWLVCTNLVLTIRRNGQFVQI